MLDTIDLAGLNTRCTFIEPYPDRLRGLLRPGDDQRHTVVEDVVQNVELTRFTELKAGDILFIDSSHVAKIGSDVVHLLTHVLPALTPGVFVHFHDIFWPFEYPEDWVRRGQAWNENYVLKAFLQYNPVFRILLFNDYLAAHHTDVLSTLARKDPGGSLWLQKVAA